VFISVVNNPNSNGVAPIVLGTFCTHPTRRFSWDVAAKGADGGIFLDHAGLPARTVGFLAQSMYPPGISGTQPTLRFAGTLLRFPGERHQSA
jgi:hypothetical protein